MKKKLIKLMGVGLTIVLAASMLFGAAPVSAGDLSWGSESVPTTTGNVITANTSMNVADLAVAVDGTMYLVSGHTNQCYKSTNGGVTWSTLSKNFGNTLDHVAVAPDDSDYVAVVDSTLKVWVSTNGGSTWGDLGVPDESALPGHDIASITDFTMSFSDGGKHYIAAAGATSGGNVTDLWDVLYFDLGASAPKWNSTREDGGSPDYLDLTTALAVRFSPNVASDAVMAVVATSAAGVTYQLYSLSTKVWNDPFNISAVAIQDAGANITGATSACLALAPDYLGSDDSLRVAFVGVGGGGASAGVYRLKDTSDKEINEGSGNDAWSIDYDGTNLIVGSAINDKVWRSADPMDSSPSFSTTTSTKRPGVSGVTNVIVAWNGADVVAGSTGLGSAFSVSTDNGKSFNDISFIDMAGNLGYGLDVAVSDDGSVIYMLVAGDSGLSLFRKASSWQRVFASANFSNDDGIVRIAPDDPDAVYIADPGGKDIYFSSEGGDTKWFKRTSKENVGDLAVESADVSYVAVSGGKTVSKSTNSGFTWGSGKDTGVGGSSIDTIRSLGEDNVIIGSDGYVAWSTDGNSSWTDINTPLNGSPLATQVTATGLSDGDYIYAASAQVGGRVERWEIGQSGTSWKNLEAPTSGQAIYGIGIEAGVLYAVSNNTTDSYLLRTLSPTSSEPSSGMWSTKETTADFTGTPSALRMSSGSTKLWSMHASAATVTKPLYSYVDTIATDGPTLSAPGSGSEVKVNPVSGGSYAITLSWERLSKATDYDIQVATDSSFVEKIVNKKFSHSDFNGSTSTTSTPAVNIGAETLNPGTTYYWRVRVNQDAPARSQWSETRSFTVGELPEVQPPVIVQQPGPAPVIEVPPSPEIVLQPPEIVLPPPQAAPEIVIPAAPAPAAPAIPAWAIYAIIIIGAVLVIALIVLIMRTRRPV
jgi:hypothetical protein